MQKALMVGPDAKTNLYLVIIMYSAPPPLVFYIPVGNFNSWGGGGRHLFRSFWSDSIPDENISAPPPLKMESDPDKKNLGGYALLIPIVRKNV